MIGQRYRFWFERPLPEAAARLLDNVAEVCGCATDTPDAPLSAVTCADAIIAGSRLRYDAVAMDQAPALRVISRSGIGLDNVDIAAATARGIAVCNTPDGPTVSTAEHTITLLLAVAKHLRRIDNTLKSRQAEDYFSVHTGTEVRSRVLGLVGLGRIGSEVAKMALGLGMKVIAHDPFVPAERARQLGIEIAPGLEALLRQADFVSLHAPLTTETTRLINKRTLGLMKRGAYLINCARGSLVDEEALLEALQSGQLAGAGLDVFEREPPAPDHPLLECVDVIATPHIAAATAASKERTWRAAIGHALAVLKRKRPDHLANPEVWEKLA